MIYITGTDKFNENLDDWLFKNDQKNAEWLFKNKNKIPKTFRSYSKTLYRGMTINAEFLKDVYTGKMKFNNHTSWTKDIKIAEKFVNDPKYSIAKKGVKIIIQKKIPNNMQILDIHNYVLFTGIDQLELAGIDELSLDSAIKEQEILICKNLKIDKNDIKFL